MSKVSTLLDLESIADETLDDFQEAAEYINPPAGDYKLKTVSGKIAKFENEDGVKQSIRVVIATTQTLELSSHDEPPVPDGSLFTMNFQGTKEGLELFKREARKICDLETMDGMTLNDTFELFANEIEFYGRISYTKSKDKNGNVTNWLRLRIIPAPSAE
jgi:hypothetical protein